MVTFFAQPVCDVKTLYEHMFFLLYHGKGFTDVGVKQMTLDEVFWATNKLYNQLKDEQRAREEESKRVNQQASAARARARHV